MANSNQNITHMPSSLYSCIHFYTTHAHKVYLFCIVLVTLLNSWLLTDAWGWLCVSGLQSSAALIPPHPSFLCVIQSDKNRRPAHPIIFLPKAQARLSFISTIVSVCYLCMCSLTPATHTYTHILLCTPSLLPVPSVDRPAMCLFIRVPAATPLYVDGA